MPAQRGSDGSRMSQLPPLLQRPARFVRRYLPDDVVARLPGRFAWVYRSDGLATVHYSPFLDDEEFNNAYWNVADRRPGRRPDMRWRSWLLVACARHCGALTGDYAEFGVYRGASAYVLLRQSPITPGRRLHLFDTFAGIPDSDLTEREESLGFPGRLGDASLEDVTDLLAPWRGSVCFVVGDVADTLTSTETGPLAFAHVDLNAAGATERALEYAYPRLVPGAMVVLDDYGWPGYEDQRAAIDAFFAGKDEDVLALPTGQGLVIRLP